MGDYMFLLESHLSAGQYRVVGQMRELASEAGLAVFLTGGAMRDTLGALGVPYRMFGFDSDMSEVVNYAKNVDAWMRAGGRAEVAEAMNVRVAA